MNEMYAKTALLLHGYALETWKSEEAMDAVFQTLHRGPKFDRTSHGRAIVQHLFALAWNTAWGEAAPKPVLADRVKVLAELVPVVNGDFNLFTQIAPNLVDCFMQVDLTALTEEYRKLEADFKSRADLPNPFLEKRPKIKVTAATHSPEQVRHYAYTVSLLRAYNILTSIDFGNLSHRITPFGRTPAFSDSSNLCQLPAVGDAFVSPSTMWGAGGLKSGFASWGAQPDDYLPLVYLEDGTVEVPTLPIGYHLFKSESGGSMLHAALIARQTAFTGWKLWLKAGAPQDIAIIPRVNSVQVIGPASFLQVLETRAAELPWVSWTWDKRPEILKGD